MNKQILDVCFNQYDLNVNTCGLYWYKGHCENTNKHINWFTALNQELAEAIDSLDWKHWKGGKVDLPNLKMEIVDLYHFAISALEEAVYDNNMTLQSEGEKDHLLKHKEVKTDVDYCVYESAHIISKVYKEVSDMEMPPYDNHFEIITDLINMRGAITMLELHKVVSEENGEKLPPFFHIMISNLFKHIFKISTRLEMDINKLYLLKNYLNEFRQLNGYADGRYIKIWNGKEDNEVLMDKFYHEDVNFTKIKVMNYLGDVYAEVLYEVQN